MRNMMVGWVGRSVIAVDMRGGKSESGFWCERAVDVGSSTQQARVRCAFELPQRQRKVVQWQGYPVRDKRRLPTLGPHFSWSALLEVDDQLDQISFFQIQHSFVQE